MNLLETCLRERNVRLFLLIGSLPTVRAAASSVGIHPQHATRLVRVWRVGGWIVKNESGKDQRYKYTDLGQRVRKVLAAIPLYELSGA